MNESIQKLKIPAIGLMVSGGIGILAALWGFIAPMVMPAQEFDPELYGEQVAEIMNSAQAAGPIWNTICLAASVLIFIGAKKMKAGQSYGLAMTGACVSMVPLWGCCCLSWPFGIWALVLMFQAEIKQSFR